MPGILWLTNVHNGHGAMGLFGGSPFVLAGFALAVALGVGYLLRAVIALAPLAQIGYGAVLGGAAANIIDRAIHGYVLDFIVIRGFFIFNVADVFVTLGIAALAIAALRTA